MSGSDWSDDPSALRRTISWIRRRRPLLTAVFVIVLLVAAVVGPHPPADMVPPGVGVVGGIAWALMLIGVGVRIWGAGNLRKNQEITSTGIYRMVRHPLYVGSLAMFLALFLTVGNPWLGLALFAAMVVFVYYPTMIDEERMLRLRFPEQTNEYLSLRRLIPMPSRLTEALASDRFTLRAAGGNLGTRSLGFLVALPLLLEVLRWMRVAVR